jgi:hypothetical protein
MSIWAFRRAIARFGIMALLFAQMAVAAYACPVAMDTGDVLRAALTAQTSMAMPDCDADSSGNPNLCVQHCQSGNQTVQTAPHIPVPPLAVTHVVVIETILADASHGVASPPLYPERETSPPPLLRFGFLRI